MYLSEINIPDWAEKHDPSCMSHSHISQGATNPMLHKQNRHQSSQWLLSHQWKQSHLQPEPLSSQKWNWTHTSKSTAPTTKSENPCSEYIHTSRSELYNIQMVEETITNGNVSIKVRFEVYEVKLGSLAVEATTTWTEEHKVSLKKKRFVTHKFTKEQRNTSFQETYTCALSGIFICIHVKTN